MRQRQVHLLTLLTLAYAGGNIRKVDQLITLVRLELEKLTQA